MTPQELRFLFQAGSNNYPNQLVTPLALVFCYGIGFPVFVLAMNIFWQQGLRTRAKKIMFTTTIFCLILNTLGTFIMIVDMANDYNAIHLLIEKNSDLKATTYILSRNNFQNGNINNWTFSLLLLVSDAVVIWRAWVLFPDRLWIMTLPCLILLASLGCTLSEDIRLSSWSNWIAYPTDDPLDANLNTATGWLSFATNGVSTMLIGYRLWAYRRLWTKDAGLSTERMNSPVQKTLFLLVESGVVFCLSQIVTLVVQYLSQNRIINTYISSVISRSLVAAMFSFGAVYPTLIIVLIHSRNSVMESYNLPTVVGKQGLENSPTEKPFPTENLHVSSNSNLQTIQEGGGSVY